MISIRTPRNVTVSVAAAWGQRLRPDHRSRLDGIVVTKNFLGLEQAFDLGWVISFRSRERPSVQAQLVSGDATALLRPRHQRHRGQHR
ncbi:MAG TPA: hypothetical protein VGO16_02405 [Pseudonocardiaceae bacterium]|nr:hypothetical protein [Pseudonocardiaceae bacterium]